jgi:pyruvate/2-oxoglutarate dehydrogenase complex dihydrolipoamide acyltransferase (E2) component
MNNILMPQLGETVAEGKILSWFKAVGDDVRAGDSIFEVETDKVTMEVQAIASGSLSEIRVPSGGVAKVGEIVAVIGLIAQNDLDVDTIAKAVSSAGGRKITQKDIQAALKARSDGASEPSRAGPLPASVKPAESPVQRSSEIVPLNTIRRRTGERLAENWRTIPHVFQAIEIDFTGVETTRIRQKEDMKTRNGIGLTYLPFIARAICLALQDFPQINARLEGQALVLSREVHLGIAVDLSHEGLVVPVVRHADELTVAGLARGIARLVDKARTNKLTGEDLSGGTYSISNNGSFGTSFTAPIINAPQVAILSVDAIRKQPVVIETPEGEFIAPRLVGMVGQSFDHRAFDGAYSAAFLSKLKTIIEQRDWSAEFG